MSSPSPGEPPLTNSIAWTSWREAAWFIVTGRTRRPALRVAIVVGILLSLVNQTGALLHGQFSVGTVARLAANFAVPYLVSSLGFLSAHRSPGA